jgi:hypothetical protein
MRLAIHGYCQRYLATWAAAERRRLQGMVLVGGKAYIIKGRHYSKLSSYRSVSARLRTPGGESQAEPTAIADAMLVR